MPSFVHNIIAIDPMRKISLWLLLVEGRRGILQPDAERLQSGLYKRGGTKLKNDVLHTAVLDGETRRPDEQINSKSPRYLMPLW